MRHVACLCILLATIGGHNTLADQTEMTPATPGVENLNQQILETRGAFEALRQEPILAVEDAAAPVAGPVDVEPEAIAPVLDAISEQPQSSPVSADLPTIGLPVEVKGNPGAFIKVAATTNGHEVRWFAATPGLNVFPGEMLKASRATVVYAAEPGEYTLVAYTALGDMPSDPATVQVIVGTPPPPVPPTPPIPPVPPAPLPTPELQGILAPVKTVMASSDKTKAALWAGIWSDFSVTLNSGQVPASTGSFKSALQAFANAAATKAGLVGAFPGFSAALEQSCGARFGSEDGALDPTRAREFTAAIAWATTP